MKTLIQTVVLVFFTLGLEAQTQAPQPPKVPSTYPSTHSSSISVSKTDDDYRIKARFHKSRYEAVKNLLQENLGTDGLTVNGDTYKWSHGSNNFECKLSRTSLRLFLDYGSANKTFINHIEKIGENLKYAISGGDPEEDIKRAEADVTRAKEELERAKERLAKKKN